MKKYLFTICISMIFSHFPLNGQITYEISDYTSAGESFQVINAIDDGSHDFAETGADFTWDFSGIMTSEPESYGYENPNNSPFKNIWCLLHIYITNCNSKFNENFNLGLNLGENFQLGDLPISDPYQHLLKTDTEVLSKMYGFNLDTGEAVLPLLLEYDDPDMMFKFPMTYNDSYTDINTINMDFGMLGVDLAIQGTGTRANMVEGWGALKIPNHQFDSTLKVKSVLEQNLQITMEGEDMEIPITMTSYFWFDKSYGIPVMMVNGIETAGIFVPGIITYLYFEEEMGLADLTADRLTVYPNPTTGELNLNLKNGETLQAVQVFDQSGRVVSNKLDLTGLTSGVYVLKIQTDKRVITEKVIKK